MSYQVLARKWRPKSFQEVVGQQHVLTAFANALSHQRVHHAYLLSGTRGVGKTTIARLFAKGLNCETGITATPCGVCQTCLEIDQGRYVDLLEIDAASRTKVEDTREILDNVQYKPARARYKVYLIDEVHMLSRSSFNALLKTLEEPPEYVKFILATTDPQKLPITILSRCLQFNLKHLQPEQIAEHLIYILKEEGIFTEPLSSSQFKGVHLLAHAGKGSMRDALSLTDQALALGDGMIDEQIISAMLGTLGKEYAPQLLLAIAQGEIKTLLDLVQHIATIGGDWFYLTQSLAQVLHRLAMYQVAPDTLPSDIADDIKYKQLIYSLHPQDIQLYYEIVIQGQQGLNLAPDQRSGFEMLLLRMFAFRPTPLPNYQAMPIVAHEPLVVPEPLKREFTREVNVEKEGESEVSEPNYDEKRELNPSVAIISEPFMATQATPYKEPTLSEIKDAHRVDSTPDIIHSANDLEELAILDAQEEAYESSLREQLVPLSDLSPSSSPSVLYEDNTTPSISTSTSAVSARAMLRQHRQTLHTQELPLTEEKKIPENSITQDNIEQKQKQKQKQEGTQPPQLETQHRESQNEVEQASKNQFITEANELNQPQEDDLQKNIATESEIKAEKEPFTNWQEAMKHLESEQKTVKLTTIDEIKQSISITEPSIAIRREIFKEVSAQDPWTHLIEQMKLTGMMRTFAFDLAYSVLEESDTMMRIQLCLREGSLYKEIEIKKDVLQEKFTQYFKRSVTVDLKIDNHHGKTPKELRNDRYNEKLEQAKKDLQNDPAVLLLQEKLLMTLDSKTIKPLK